MSFSPIYILVRGAQFFFLFLKHWYVDGFSWFIKTAIDTMEKIDRTFAFKITLRNFFKPLYGDYTVMGHILGFIFRPLRLFVGGVVYIVIIAVFLMLYGAWMLVPPALVWKTVTG